MSLPANYQASWQPTLPTDQNIGEYNDSPSVPIGTRIEVEDRVFYYTKFQATAIPAAGGVYCMTQWNASHQSGIMVFASTAAGAKVLLGTSSAAVAQNYYADGYFGVAASTGQGFIYKVKANAAGSTGFSLTLYDGLAHDITSGSAFWLIPNPFKDVFIGSSPLHIPIGLVNVSTSSATNNYGWLQTWGPSNALHTAATPAGAALTLATGNASNRVAPLFTASTAAWNQVWPIGKNGPLAATASQRNPIFLQILF